MNGLRSIAFFEHLSPEQADRLAARARERRFREGEILFYAGEAATVFIFVLSGSVRIYKTDPRGNEVLLHRFGPGSALAEMATLEQRPYPASARFEEEGTALFIDYATLKSAIEEDAALAFALMGSLVHKIKSLEQVIEMNLVLDATARIAKFIVERPDDFAALRKHLVAERLNMTPETFSRSLKKLKSMELIGSDDRILDETGLRSLYEA